MINVDLNAPYQTYPDKLPDQPAAGVAFSTGSTPWGFAASIGLGLGGDVRADSLDAVLRSADDTVLLFAVDKGYVQVGERLTVPPKADVQRVRVNLAAGACALVIQASEDPRGRPVVLEEVVLNNEE